MSLVTPDKIRELQIQLYRKAKNEPDFRFYQLYDKVYRKDVLRHAWALAKANHGAPGVDGESFEAIETGREYLGCSPSNKSVNQIKQSVGEHLKPDNVRPWEKVRDRLNQKLKGWQAYFELGSPSRAYQVLDEHVEERVRHFLRRRHKVSSQGTRQFSTQRIYGESGVYRLRGPLGAART
jgi:hypothetical protein